MSAAVSDEALMAGAQRLGERLIERNRMLVTAESCTGGWIAKLVTDLPGSSRWFERGFITYSNASKTELLGVSAELLLAHGAVSGETVEAMVKGALSNSRAQVAVAVSGVAGPDGGTVAKPVGTVWFGFSSPGYSVISEREHFVGGRDSVRRRAVRHALQRLLDLNSLA